MPGYSAQHYLSDFDRCLAHLKWAFQKIQCSVSYRQLQQWASLIMQTNSGLGRYFHGPEHTLQLAERMSDRGDALAALAALFHDTIYLQIDNGVPEAVRTYLHGQVQIDAGGRLSFPAPSSLQALVIHLFELPQLEACWTKGQPVRLPPEQCNEFLSALLAAHALEPVLSLRQIAAVVVAIEATIPFRLTENGQRPSDRRFQRLQSANQRFGLGFSQAELNAAICRSVHLTNSDLYSFAAEDPTFFLDQTWLLLPEFTPALRVPNQYRPEDYRQAVRNMELFLEGLKADEIFQRFHGIPEDEHYRSMVERARHNLAVGCLYLKTKVVAITILEVLTRYRAPSLSMQELLGPTSSFCQLSSWEQRFPIWNLRHPLNSDVELKVLQIAEEGRITHCSFDLLRSPLATLLIRSIGFDRIRVLREQVEYYFNGELSEQALLSSCEAKVVQALNQTLPQFV